MKHVWMSTLNEYKDTYPWKLEIIDGSYEEEHMSPLMRLAPNLRVITSQRWDFSQYFEGFISNSGHSLDPQISISVSGAKNLGTIHTTNRNPLLSPPISTDTFPSLRYLSIGLDTPFPLEQQEIHTLLQHIGPQLHTFYFRHRLYPATLDPSLWNILPNVDNIQLPFQWAASDVPKEHPLKRVQVAAWEIPYEFNDDSAWNSALSLYCPLSPQRKLSFAMDATWKYHLFENPSFAMCIWSYFEDKNAHLEDAHGDSLSQYILFLIKAFWKQPQRTYCKTPAHE
ncbi:hypothetical protein M408DRAFT_27002 [Serendipita vermifera MAFF 305830]|uniref:Uncharacterized protein n=1 Tax=Serendipita vermifera MAFF 305830 TaxID=933852 RepID=A0A0C2WDI1_SERVB|nr:hypothetical protein M408DRAFT_27002 [Serendipita vermifera MAFF 305830]